MSTYNVNVKQSGNQSTSVVGDHAQVISKPSSSPQDLVRLLKAIRNELDRMNLPSDAKAKARLEVDRAIVQAEKDEPDKPTLIRSLKNAAEVIKHSSSIVLGTSKFWPLVRKAIQWMI
jgi:hypothetical protein